MIGCQAHTREEPVGKKEQNNGHDAEVHVIMAVIKGVIPMKRYVSRLSGIRVVGVVQSQKLWIHVVIVNIEMPFQKGFCQQLILVHVIRLFAVVRRGKSHGNDA